MSDTEKGFTVKDHRSLNEEGELKDKSEGKDDEKQNQKAGHTQGAEDQRASHPLPEANFTALIFSLSSTALFHMGEIGDPQTGENKTDLPLAKHAIDTIAMLQEKTAGNLTEEEDKFTKSILTDLRWRFVKAKK